MRLLHILPDKKMFQCLLVKFLVGLVACEFPNFVL